MYADTAATYILQNTSGVTSLVSTKVYLGRARQTALKPFVLVEANGIDPTDQKPGTDTGVSRLDQEEILVFCYGTTYTEAQTLAIAVRAALDKKVGATYNGINVQSIQYLSEDYFDDGLDPVTYVFEERFRFRIIR